MLLIHLAFAGVGWSIAQKEGALIGAVIALGFHLVVFWYAEKIMLKLHNAREVGSDDPSPMIRAFVADCDRLAMKANMPRPRTYIVDAFQPNAFVAGRDTNHASIAVTDGLLKTLTRAEVSAVVAHELAHVKRGDALAMGICSALAVVLTTIFGSLAYPLGQRKRVSRVVAGLVARVGQSHHREYAADKHAGEICGNPINLANALLKLERHTVSLLNPLAERSPATAHTFVIDPLHGKRRTARPLKWKAWSRAEPSLKKTQRCPAWRRAFLFSGSPVPTLALATVPPTRYQPLHGATPTRKANRGCRLAEPAGRRRTAAPYARQGP